MKIVHEWLSELAPVPADIELTAREISLRGFEVAGVEDGVIDFEITANRPDCLSHLGIAREAHVIWGPPAKGSDDEQAVTGVDGDRTETVDVSLEAADLCPRYTAQVFDVTVGPSPAWLVARLEAAGVRSINNVVDVTNYVMLEIGQPMHAFDLDRLAGRRLVIRRARPGERLTTLDGVDRALEPETLVIADAERAVAVGGVMGGADSEISATTTKMVLESAYFVPASVRRTSKRLGLKTEASTRFERGADIEAPPAGLARAARLLRGMGAIVAGPVIDAFPQAPALRSVRLRASRIARLLGVPVPADDVVRILSRLGFSVAEGREEDWQVTVPTFRVDVTREIDLIEEVGRHFGFDRLPTTFPALVSAQAPPDPRITRDGRIRRLLTSAGLSESMTFAFIERAAAEPFCAEGVSPAAIANPLSEKFAVLRPSMLPGLIDSAAHNRRRGRKDVQLFEIGSRFTATGEGRAVGLVATGLAAPAHWSGGSRAVDFFDVKGAVELLCDGLDVRDLAWEPTSAPYLSPGRAAVVRSGATVLGVAGHLRPAIAEARGFSGGDDVFVAELDVDALTSSATRAELRAQTLPRFPGITRDLSILVDEALPAADVRGTIRRSAPATLQSMIEFDRYQGKGIPERRISLSLRLTFRSPERTLTDDEVDAAMQTIVGALERDHRAQRR